MHGGGLVLLPGQCRTAVVRRQQRHWWPHEGRRHLRGCVWRGIGSGRAAVSQLPVVRASRRAALVTSVAPSLQPSCFYRGLSTALTARASIPSTPTATGKAESSSAPGISITCTYQVLIQTYLFRAPLRQERRPEDRSQCCPSFLLCLCSGFLCAEAHPSSR